MCAARCDLPDQQIEKSAFIPTSTTLLLRTDLITAFQVSALSWQPGATAAWLAVGWESGELYLYHHSSAESAESSASSTGKKCLKVDTLHAAAVFLMQWSPAGSRLVTADKNGSVVGWKVDPGTYN